MVVVDRDHDDCDALKLHLERAAKVTGLRTRTRAGNAQWQLVNRIAVEELEAWYFGDWQAVCAAYPRVAATVPKRQGFRNSDGITGGTWEAFERVVQRYGYFKGGLAKIAAARAIGAHIDPVRTRSRSFASFTEAITEAVG